MLSRIKMHYYYYYYYYYYHFYHYVVAIICPVKKNQRTSGRVT